ncbi:hypothetical protein C5F51_36290 [Nocardia nova]|uniref:Uncharacterized protein n=2 Tax=Nocardia nova TaxID=37330 RepID=A0A2S5ZUC8_9NOCA|nr:hypothetical protein C5F51_36290 [Nocardia nova]
MNGHMVWNGAALGRHYIFDLAEAYPDSPAYKEWGLVQWFLCDSTPVTKSFEPFHIDEHGACVHEQR